MSRSVVRRAIHLSACLLTLAIVGCTARVGAENVAIPEDAAAMCAEQCGAVGMRLGALAIMADNIGCVCEPNYPPAAAQGTLRSRSTATAGMATIMMQRQAQQNQQNQQTHHH